VDSAQHELLDKTVRTHQLLTWLIGAGIVVGNVYALIAPQPVEPGAPAWFGLVLLIAGIGAAAVSFVIDGILERGRASRPAVGLGGRPVRQLSTLEFVRTLFWIRIAYAEGVGVMGGIYSYIAGLNIYGPLLVAVSLAAIAYGYPRASEWEAAIERIELRAQESAKE